MFVVVRLLVCMQLHGCVDKARKRKGRKGEMVREEKRSLEMGLNFPLLLATPTFMNTPILLVSN